MNAWFKTFEELNETRRNLLGDYCKSDYTEDNCIFIYVLLDDVLHMFNIEESILPHNSIIDAINNHKNDPLDLYTYDTSFLSFGHLTYTTDIIIICNNNGLKYYSLLKMLNNEYQGILTEREIRIAHNIQKLVLNGEFGIAKHVKLEK